MDYKIIEQKILQNYNNNKFSVQQLSYNLKISNSYLRELIWMKYNMSPQKLIETIRLESAFKLLTKKEKVYSVAIKSGYSSTRALRRACKKRLGVSPNRLKELIKNQYIVNDENIVNILSQL